MKGGADEEGTQREMWEFDWRGRRWMGEGRGVWGGGPENEAPMHNFVPHAYFFLAMLTLNVLN